ncbi:MULTISPECIES: MBL fold metallo-hydrolase [Olivibacter]|uniref:MBL fold metallo-hydrolase n=1 Tax=Olivibacter jilunii TaxID=985016 RepID=A0ABW6B1L2_9SPHI
MNRRTLLKNTAAAALGASLPLKDVFAAQTKVSNETLNGYLRFNLGELKMLIVTDGHILVSPAQPIFAPQIDTEQVREVMKENFIFDDNVDAAINILVIRKEDRIIVIDTGSGALLGSNAGRFLNNLQAAGIAPDEVTDVLLTHLHIDHIGGILDAAGERVFSNASYYLSKEEYDFWMADDPDFSKSKNPNSGKESVMLARRVMTEIHSKLHLFNLGTVLFDCIKTDLAAGHTPGHPVLTIFSGEFKLKHMVDTVHHTLLLARPDWGTQWDTDFEKGIRTRQQILSELATERQLVMSCHLPWPGLGYVSRKKIGYGWIPMPFSTPLLFE